MRFVLGLRLETGKASPPRRGRNQLRCAHRQEVLVNPHRPRYDTSCVAWHRVLTQDSHDPQICFCFFRLLEPLATTCTRSLPTNGQCLCARRVFLVSPLAAVKMNNRHVPEGPSVSLPSSPGGFPDCVTRQHTHVVVEQNCVSRFIPPPVAPPPKNHFGTPKREAPPRF